VCVCEQVRYHAAVGCPEDSLRRRPGHRLRITRSAAPDRVATERGTWPRLPDSVGCRPLETLIRFTCETAEGLRSSAT